MNEESLALVCELEKEGKLKERVYIANTNPNNLVKGPWGLEEQKQVLLSCTMKEKPQIKKAD